MDEMTEFAAYCLVCKSFSTSDSKDVEFVSVGFKDWKNAKGEKRGILFGHENSERHQRAAILASNILKISRGKMSSIAEHINTEYVTTVKKNREILLLILDVIIVLGRKNLPLRGSYSVAAHKEDGNFQYFVDWKSTFDPILAEHVKTCKKNAKYFSPKVQNMFIDCCGGEIRSNIVDRCKQSKIFSVMADESQDVSVKSQL